VTLREFLSTLTSTNRKVTFPGGETLEAHADLLASMVAGTLKRLLSEAAEVHSGWQTKTMPDGWGTGSFQCWLIVDDDLVKVDAIAREEQADISDITARVLPLHLHHPAPAIVLSYHRTMHETVVLESLGQMRADFAIDSEAFHTEAHGDSIDALSRFVRELANATARSRAPRGHA
jgi:hypothetical protein